jgi:hypothetical protein
MSNLFIKPDDEIKITFAIAFDENKKVYSAFHKEELEEMFKGSKTTINEVNVVFKKPSFKDIVELSNQKLTTGSNGLTFNPFLDRYHKMIKLMKSWSLTDNDGNAIKPTEEAIGELSPCIADTMARLLEVEIGTSY